MTRYTTATSGEPGDTIMSAFRQGKKVGTNTPLTALPLQDLLVIVMLETNDFFQAQINKCKRLAEGAVDKNEREFWVRLADRWAELLRARQRGGSCVEAAMRVKIVRPNVAKRPAA